MAYYCTKCKKAHRSLSGIGKRHKKYEGEPPFTVTGSTATTFTESLVNDLREHVKCFPQMPHYYTARKHDEARSVQTAWIRKLKDILIME